MVTVTTTEIAPETPITPPLLPPAKDAQRLSGLDCAVQLWNTGDSAAAIAVLRALVDLGTGDTVAALHSLSRLRRTDDEQYRTTAITMLRRTIDTV